MMMPRASDKEAGDDIPSWAKGTKPCPGKTPAEQAKDMMNEKYGNGNWKDGPGSEFNKIKKFLEKYHKRHKETPNVPEDNRGKTPNGPNVA